MVQDNSDATRSVARHWSLDPRIAFLNHGSFGACPYPVLEQQHRLRRRLERQPVQFFVRDLEELFDEARTTLADFLGAAPADVALVRNATSGVNAVLRSMDLHAGDELLLTSHEYNACRNAAEYVAARAGASVVVADVPFPLRSGDAVLERVLGAIGPSTRLLLIDHITSQTAMIMPLARIATECAARGVEVLVDGAHAPGMVPLDLATLGVGYYTGNCHKWLCAPKGSGFLWVREDLQPGVRPAVISHGANTTRRDRSRFLIEFDWVGTDDPTPFLCVPRALEFMGSLLPGGWEALRQRNRALALAGRAKLCAALDCAAPCPDEMIGSIASLPLPPGSGAPSKSPLYADPLQDELLARWQIEVPVVPWPAQPQRLLRISAQIYNHEAQYQRLANALGEIFA